MLAEYTVMILQLQIHKHTTQGKRILGEYYCMFAGDANADNIVNDLDKTGSWMTEVGLAGYLSSDLNFDGQSNNVDKNDLWQINYNEQCQVP